MTRCGLEGDYEVIRKNKPSESRLFVGLRKERLDNGSPRILRGNFQDSRLSYFLNTVEKNDVRQDVCLWDTETAMEKEASTSNNLSGIAPKLGNCSAWSGGGS